MEDEIKNKFKLEIEALATIRDEFKVKAHLAKSDVKDELTRLESKLRLAEEEVRRVATHAKAEAGKLKIDLHTLTSELKQGYENIRRSFS